MRINKIYPEIAKKISKTFLLKRIIILLSLIAVLTCSIINVCTGGKWWLLYVVGGIVIFYFSFLDQPLIENTFIKRFTMVIFLICGYLYLIDFIEKTNWSYYVITIIFFSVLIVQAIILFSLYDMQKKQILPIFYTTIGSIILIILALFGVITLNWPLIVLGSLSVFLLILFLTIFRKNIIKELKKYFYLK